tara:strand:- start:804 stop:1160 length:357 start_codon:yes stop_codon:yes gene_type:complete
MDRRFILEGLECMASIGIYDAERAAPQRVIIDAELQMFTATEPKDDLVETTLNYDLIRETIMEIVMARHYDLQETLARQLFDALCQLHDVRAVCVRTAKPDAYDDCRQIAYQLSNIAG